MALTIGSSPLVHAVKKLKGDANEDRGITANDTLKVLRKAVGWDLSREACSW